MIALLEELGANVDAVAYIRQWKGFMKLGGGKSSPQDYGGGVAKTVSMFGALLNQGSALVVEGVKNFVLKESKLPVTRIVDNLVEVKNCEEDKEFCLLDPKLLRPQQGEAPHRPRQPFQDCVVF